MSMDVSKCSVEPAPGVPQKLSGDSLPCLIGLVRKICSRVWPLFLCLGRPCYKVILPPAGFLLSKLEKDEEVLGSILENSKKYRNSPDFLPYYYCCRLLLLSKWQVARLLPKLLHAELEWVGDASPSQRASAILRVALDKYFVSAFAKLIAKERGEEVQKLPEVRGLRVERTFLMALLQEKSVTSWLNSHEVDLFCFQNTLVEFFIVNDDNIDISLPDKEGNTILHLVKSPEFAEKLIKHNPSALNIKNDRGETPLENVLMNATPAFTVGRQDFLKLVQVFLKQGSSLPPDENHTLIKEILKEIIDDFPLSEADGVRLLIDEIFDWQSVDSIESLLESVISAASVDFLGRLAPSTFLDLLFGAAIGLNMAGLKRVLLDSVERDSVDSCRGFIRFLKKRDAEIIQKCDPNQELAARVIDRIFRDQLLFVPEPEWAGLLPDIGFKSTERFLMNFLTNALKSNNFVSGIEELCERLIDAQSEQEKGVSDVFFVTKVVQEMLKQAALNKKYPLRRDYFDKERQFQLHLRIFERLIARDAGIPDEIDGVPFTELLATTPGLEKVEESFFLIRRRRMTKNARRGAGFGAQ